ncbi:MAG: hypothetical protein HPY90_14380 [Syntrophothermus sp.]|uniref:hypothetical protein n=1 Tax=Syntrophothermus sp. TaxID=2736299 RepID=UPI00257A0E34|nr:hypothetical protein [Syntrophothermus sp.]NSW84423.1 hypothetical protein [Syntrophothermus sp.]
MDARPIWRKSKGVLLARVVLLLTVLFVLTFFGPRYALAALLGLAFYGFLKQPTLKARLIHHVFQIPGGRYRQPEEIAAVLTEIASTMARAVEYATDEL